MKKTITLLLLALLTIAMESSAQGFRRWDFTKWSQQTIDNLIADDEQGDDIGWSDVEYLNNPAPVDHRCFWYQDGANYGTLKANGEVIAELEGLVFGEEYCGNRSLAIAVDYASTNIGTYDGGQYLWLGINNAAYAFYIPNVMVGEKITMSVESHRSGQGRDEAHWRHLHPRCQGEQHVGELDAARRCYRQWRHGRHLREAHQRLPHLYY